MGKRDEQPVSVDRRSFFRQLLASALNHVEKSGRELAARTRFPLESLGMTGLGGGGEVAKETHAPARYSWEVSGPPWPPPLGPPVPMGLQVKLREERRRGSEESVSRSANPEAGEAARSAEGITPPYTPD